MENNTLEQQEIQNKSWQKALTYGFKMEKWTNLDGWSAAPEADMKEDRVLADKLSKSFNPPRSVTVFVWKESTVVRFSGKEYYVELTISNQVLATWNKIETIKEFYSASILLLQNKKKVQKTAQAELSDLQDTLTA